ncbi:hypothetical protein F4778DRAFT_784222 [Xylariomycetidae sp. FL2044]|nr:hypothetical protein F4778DRAFT_784222 [Xylariomycetidae sp. FL2044]
MATALGLLASTLGIISFALNPLTLSPLANRRIKEAGGQYPDIRLFDEFGDFLGGAWAPNEPWAIKPEAGEFGDIPVYQNGKMNNIGYTGTSKLHQAPYTLFTADIDDVCVAMASITWPDGTKWHWLGDMSQICDLGDWYLSSIRVGNFLAGEETKSHIPKCLWIDGDKRPSKDEEDSGALITTYTTAFSVHWPSISFQGTQMGLAALPNDVVATNETEWFHKFLCRSGPPFALYTDMDQDRIDFSVEGRQMVTFLCTQVRYGSAAETPGSWREWAEKNKDTWVDPLPPGDDYRHTRAKRQVKHNQKLVLTDYPEHSMEELCGSKNSLGPDTVSTLEGKFCRMSDKTLWPVCNAEIPFDCFDVDLRRLRESGISFQEQKGYLVEEDWTAQKSAGPVKRDQVVPW